MCTVSYYKCNDQVIITSNRDENINRPFALAPTKILLKNSAIYCPIDPQHNGTWFAVNQFGSVFVMLNGAEKKHIPNPPFKKSRGLVLLDIADNDNFKDKWQSIDLEFIDNFTIVVYSNSKLVQLRWNGINKSYQNLDENKPHIWSSYTLYEERVVKQREEWFFNFLAEKNNNVNCDDIIEFHTNTNKNDKINGLIINRTNNILTKNITQAIMYPDSFKLKHLDLIKNEKTKIEELY